MARTATPPLDSGALFPTMTFQLADGGTLTLPTGLTADFAIILGYRGKW
jgi:hypothetical protein